MFKRSIHIQIRFIIALSTTAAYLTPNFAYANAEECAVAVHAPAVVAKAKEIDDFENLFAVDNTVATSAVAGLEIKKTSLPSPIGVSDKNADRAAKNEAKAKAALSKINAASSPEEFQKSVDQISGMIRSSLQVPESESLSASKLLDTKLSEMRELDERQRIVEGDMRAVLKQFRQLNPDVSAMYKEESYSWIKIVPVIGKKIAKTASQKADEMYERVTSARQGINDAIGAVRAGGVQVQGAIDALKADRVTLIKVMKGYEERTALLLALDKVFYEHLRDNTSETDAQREFFTTQIIKPIRQILLDIESMKDSVNNALLLNFSLVERGQELVDRTGRMTDRLVVDFATTLSTQIALNREIRQTELLNDAEKTSAAMKKGQAESFVKHGEAIRSEEKVLDQVTQMINEKNAMLEKELKEHQEYNDRIVNKLAEVIKDRNVQNERMKATVLRLEEGEQFKHGSANKADTLAEALRESILGRQHADQEVVEAAKIEAPKKD